jgi:hypothetical protein
MYTSGSTRSLLRPQPSLGLRPLRQSHLDGRQIGTEQPQETRPVDPNDPSQRPSIFSRPDPIDNEPRSEEPATRSDARDPRSDAPDPRSSLPPPRYPPPGYERYEDASPPPSRRLLIALGGGGLLLLLIAGFVAASVFRGDDPDQTAASPSLEASASATPQASASATASPSASPTPSPTPAGPPQDLALGSWATVTTGELNVRAQAGTNATSNYLLVQGAVVYVADGPSVVDGLNWYRIASLGGATGWATSGWVSEPYVTTLVEDPTLIRCGDVQRSVFDIVNGAPVPHDPLAIGDFALPVAAFSDISLAAMELMRGVGKEACFTAQLDASGAPVVTAQLDVNACGRAVRDGSFFRMRPASGQGVPTEYQVKDPLVVDPVVLASAVPNDPREGNARNVMLLIAERDDTTGCVFVGVNEAADQLVHSSSVTTTQCFLVYEHGIDGITIGAAAGGNTKRILTSEGSAPPFTWALNTPVPLYVSVSSSTHGSPIDAGPQSQGYVYDGYDPSCA